MSKRHVYRLDIATAVGMTQDESERCLRAMLKAMLRQWDCRCLSAVAITAADDENKVDNINFVSNGDAGNGDA